MTTAQARYAERRGLIRLGEKPGEDGRHGVQAFVCEVSCDACKRPFLEVQGIPCSAIDSTEHLRGGPIGERKKRGPRPKPEDALFEPVQESLLDAC
jgi:hypothetical protein